MDSVCWLVVSPVRSFAIASISSINMIAGAYFLAVLNNRRIFSSLFPTYEFINCVALVSRNATSDSPAIALASIVFPVPGGPYRSTPLGSLRPSMEYFFGFFKNSVNQASSVFAFSAPITSENFVVGRWASFMIALWLSISTAILFFRS